MSCAIDGRKCCGGVFGIVEQLVNCLQHGRPPVVVERLLAWSLA